MRFARCEAKSSVASIASYNRALRNTLSIGEGSVEDGSPEPPSTGKDSGILADDDIVVDSTMGGPTIKHSDSCLLTNYEDVVPDGPDVQLLPPKRVLRQHRQKSSAACQGENNSDESSPEGSDYNDAKQGELSSGNDNTDELPMPSCTQPQQVDEDRISPAPPARRANGKGREVPPRADYEDLDDDQHQEAIHKAVALGEKTVAEVKKIAKEYGKSARMILIQAGLAVKATRADNNWNMYQAWYKMKHPKSSNISTNDWKQTQHEYWLKHCDQSENPKLWKEIHEFWEGTSKNPDESSKTLYNHIMAVHDVFALSCQAYSHLEDIYVGGFVLYTGTEEAGQRAAGVFAGSPLILDLVNKKQADIKELMDYLTTIIKYNHIDDTASLPSFTRIMAPKFNPELLCEKGEGTRDRNRCVAPIMMLEKFGEKYSLETMLNSLYLHQAQVVDWPAGVPPVGSDFVFKDLKTDELKALVGPYLKRCMGSDYNAELARVEHPELKKKRKDKLSGVKVPEQELMFVPWSDESKDLMSNEDSDMLNIPLITDTDESSG
ncbi:hypothetical protein EV702DRAFT_1198450 [Suillus placidus]|uniref:Uncharacterized protein n=1 Tax=Suillus placidus TaxID=48579 RepID=A0A9P7D0Y3_9AGAM|nr:hypothetical protein EV702DRAFT_1198450 [Suillus placidus]